tara:strand:+ start:400 stop:849 length:450 start_codon:yes stop_codon:yes gene_type:complete
MITAQITGNVTKDPELKPTPDGGQVAKLSVAVKQKSQKKNGEWVDRKPWYVDAEIWGRDAAKVVEKVRKGDYVLLTGTLEREHWTSQQDNQERESFKLKKTQYEVLVSSVDRQVLKAQRATAPQPDSPHQAANPNWNQAPLVPDAEIPF